MRTRIRSNTKHVVARALVPLSILSLLALSACGGVFTGAYGYFTSSSSAAMSLTVGGSIKLSWNDTAAAGSNLTLAVGPLMPTDSVQRIADLANTGSVGISQVQLAITGTGTGSSSDGVQLALDRCSVPWTVAGAAFTCSGALTSISPDRPVQATLALSDSPVRTAAKADHLRFTFRLPDSSPTGAQNSAGSVRVVATGFK